IWGTAYRISVEDLLSQHSDLPRSFLLRELLLSEMRLLDHEGNFFSLRDYRIRFPEDEVILRSIFDQRQQQSNGQPSSIIDDISFDALAMTRQDPFENADPSEATVHRVDPTGGVFSIANPISVSQLSQDDFDYPTFPGYKISQVLGQGGMGVVYLAWEIETKRWVALKTLRSDISLAATSVKRFQKEVNAYRQLDHPHIVKFLKEFNRQGCPVLVLEYARAGSLARILNRGFTLPPEIAALMIEQLASAVALAHENKLLHRDITPNNILFDLPDACETDPKTTRELLKDMDREIQQDRFDWTRIVPKLTDFGLLLSLEESEDPRAKLTAHGQVMGTPSYMAPESISPRFGVPSFQTDVYGLGACLYASMTGKPPHVGFNFVDTMHRVISDDVVSPRLISNHISPNLNEICLKCLERNRNERFASAKDLHSDLVRFRNGKRLKFAQPPGILARGFKWVRKYPTVALSMLSILCVGLFLTFLLRGIYRRTVIQESKASLEAVAREELGVIRESLASQFDLVKAVGIFASEHDDFSHEQFQEFCEPLVLSHRSIKALSWAMFVPQGMRESFEGTASFSGGVSRSIYERSNQGELVLASERPSYVPVQFIVPWETNQQALGFDLASEARRRSALRRAEERSDLSITSPLQLVQDDEPVEAFLAVVPVWKKTNREPSPVDTIERSTDSTPLAESLQNKRSLKGFATGVFHTADVIEPCLRIAGSQLWLRILDITEGRTTVYTMPELRQYSESNKPLPLAFSVSMDNFGRTWEIEFFIPNRVSLEKDSSGVFIPLFGSVLSLLLTGIPLIVRRWIHA
ncbi:MAG: CHASE domain-containing protein, partial [Planctomycetes bacterium]|nr:CHASE domain-containing protein [Planctomycetota bacterium]